MGDLQETEDQLKMIEAALSADPHNPELKQLESDLKTLISLTKQSMEIPVDSSSNTKGNEDDPIFCDDEKDSSNDDIQIVQEESGKSLEDELSSLEGVKVSAPYSTEYRGTSYHNAVIFAVESTEYESFEDITVRVVFSHPTETGLVPCRHFLHSKCNRSDEDCKWSHGHKVNLAEIREWEEGDWSSIGKGSVVLSQQDTGIWARARVQDVEGEELILKLEGSNQPAVTCKLEQVVPLPGEQQEEEDTFSYNGEKQKEELPEEMMAPIVMNPSSIRLGEWENHTRGVASKLMAKMGWAGGGLGKEGEGRVEPVPARLYPEGKSLDWCMERRELAGEGQDITDVEKMLKKRAKEEARKSELRVRREKERDNSAKSLFDLINQKLGGKRTNICDMFGDAGSSLQSLADTSKGVKKKTTLKAASNEKLKIENFKIGEKIRSLGRDISKLEESYTRQLGKDTRTANAMKNKINEKKQELFRLESAEKKLAVEQGNRKASAKLTIF